MNRRSFLQALCLAPFLPLAAKLKGISPDPKPEWKVDHFLGFDFVRTELRPVKQRWVRTPSKGLRFGIIAPNGTKPKEVSCTEFFRVHNAQVSIYGSALSSFDEPGFDLVLRHQGLTLEKMIAVAKKLDDNTWRTLTDHYYPDHPLLKC